MRGHDSARKDALGAYFTYLSQSLVRGLTGHWIAPE